MLKRVEKYCRNILVGHNCSQLPFHDIIHTEEVVKQAELIGQQIGLSPQEMEPLLIAAWFHDVGMNEVYKGHEAISIHHYTNFLRELSYPEEELSKAIQCIEATQLPQSPKSELAKVLSDADIFHISQDTFFYRKLLLRREWEIVLDRFSTDLEWHQLNLEFLQQHQFFTSYGKEVLMKGQLRNEERVKKLIQLYP